MKLSAKPPAWMKSVEKFPKKVHGAAASDVADCHELASIAWGVKRALDNPDEDKNSGLTCMAYLWRRFGPSPWGYDDYKDICVYYLTTPRPDTFLWVRPNGSGLFYATGYLITRELDERLQRPRFQWLRKVQAYYLKTGGKKENYWDAMMDPAFRRRAHREFGRCPVPAHKYRQTKGLQRQFNDALLAAMRELLRPVFCRDVSINILGRCDDGGVEAAKPSGLAGLGVPLAPVRKLLEKRA